MFTQHLSLGSGVFTVGFDVHAEVLVVLGIGEAVVFFQPVNFRFTDFWNLTLVRVESCETLRGRSVATS